MKIRMGFITNSSSTNFLIISKEELTEELLFNKLGFIEGGKLSFKGHELCRDILNGIKYGPVLYSDEEPSFESILKHFGPKSAQRVEEMGEAFVYWGHTSSDDMPFTQFFTTDSFEVDEKDFYINGRSCAW